MLAFLTSTLAFASSSIAKFELHSPIIKLKPGEVHNKIIKPLKLPEHVKRKFSRNGRRLHLTNYSVDIFEYGKDGKLSQAPLYRIYNHHYILYMGSEAIVTQVYDYLKAGDPLSGVTCNKTNGTSPHLASLRTMQPTRGLRVLKLGNDYADPYLGGATGGEYRNNPHQYPAPYAFMVDQPEAFAPVLHLINTKNSTNHDNQNKNHSFSPLAECPCSPQRKFDLQAGTIDGCPPDIPFQCNSELRSQNNPGCSLEHYTGGYRCCSDGVFVSDTSGVDVKSLPTDEIVVKFSFWYEDTETETEPNTIEGSAEVATRHLRSSNINSNSSSSSSSGNSSGSVSRTRQLHSTACCDVTSDLQQVNHNIEYTIPALKTVENKHGSENENEKDGKQCQHVATNVQMLDWFKGSDKDPTEVIELVHASAHLHTGGIKLELIDDETGEMLCQVSASNDDGSGSGSGSGSGDLRYGKSSAAGDEAGFLVASKPCVWGPPPLQPPPRFQRQHKLRTVAYYNCSTEHLGVMALWLNAASVLPKRRS